MGLDVALLGQTWQRAKNEGGGLTALGMRFYKRLFDKYPAIKPLFKNPPEVQHKKLMAAVGVVIASVTKPEQMMPYLHASGIRHLKYQTVSEHYPAVQENLVAVLKEHLSKDGEWTEAMEENWNAALKVVSDVMIEAAENPAQYTTEIKTAGYQADGFRGDSDEPWLLKESAA